MMKYRLYIFDLDGTILDTLEDLTDSTNHENAGAKIFAGNPVEILEIAGI